MFVPCGTQTKGGRSRLMKHHQRWVENSFWAGLAALAFILSGSGEAAAQAPKLNVAEIVRDTQKSTSGSGEINMVWWLPDEFWQASIAANPDSTPAQYESFRKVVHPYFIIGVVSGKVASFGAIVYRPEPEIRLLVQLKDKEGAITKPLAEDKIDPSLAALLGLMKPITARMMGPLGENFQFYIFPGTQKDGGRICDPLKDGSCEVDLGERVFKWRLPLGSLLPKQQCPLCGETLSGAYKYCPYDGTKLVVSK
jgi:hypothetical protein